MGLLGTLVFSTAYFWLSSALVIACAAVLRVKIESFTGLVLGLSVGTFHFLSFSGDVLSSVCFEGPFKFSAEVEDFPTQVVGKSGDAFMLMELRLTGIQVDDDCGRIHRVSAVFAESVDQMLIQPGDTIAGHAHLRRPDYRWTNGSLPRIVRRLSAGKNAQLTIHSIDSLERGGASFHSLRAFFAELIYDSATSDRAARHLQALLLGRQNELNDADWINLRTFGMTHAFVVSGLHLGLVAFWFHGLAASISRLLNLPVSLIQRMVMAAIVCGSSYGYVILTGASLPAERALLMVTIAMLTRIALWTVQPLSIVILTGAILLTTNPFSGLTSGFWLSLVLTGVIIVQVSRPVSSRAFSWLTLHLVIVTASSFLTILFFAQTTWVGFFSNLLLVPLLTLVALPLGLMGVSLMAFGIELGKQGVILASLSVEVLLNVMAYVSTLTGDALLQSIWLHPGTLFIAVTTWLASRARRVVRVCLGCSLFLFFSSASPDRTQVQIDVIDVGQGTAIVIKSDDAVMLYDTGGESFTGRAAITGGFIRWLKQNGISKIDLLIVSHGDTDHAGGLAELQRHFDIASHYGFGGESCTAGKQISFGKNVQAHFISGTGQLLASRNDDSCVLGLTIFKSNVLLPGDISRSVELDLLAFRQLELPLELLIASHHGSNTSSSAHFVDHTSPTDVVFTTEFGHQFGHPHSMVKRRFSTRGIRSWDTGVQAGIRAEFRPNRPLSVTSMRHGLTAYWASGPVQK